MSELLVFAGTTEGRQLLDYLAQYPVQVYGAVATAYGKAVLPHYDHVEIVAGRMDLPAMVALMRLRNFACVIDATHPYAMAVTASITTACAQTGTAYLRLLREESTPAHCLYLPDLPEVIHYLKATTGNIMVTTGSKELHYFTDLPDYRQRVFPRILPMPEALSICADLGIPAQHLICMQGPFSQDLNAALLRHVQAKFLVTKESGQAGGYQEKILGAEQAGVQAIVLKRPTEQGYSLSEVIGILHERYL